MSELKSASINIDLSIFESQLRGEIAGDLMSLKASYELMLKPNYNSWKYTLHQGHTISEISAPPVDFLERREINKCFKSVMGSFGDYMDKMIAVLRFKSEPIVLTPPFLEEHVRDIVNKKLETLLREVSMDNSLNIPKKLDMLLDKLELSDYKKSVQSYFDLRNGLEHHKGIAKTDRIIRYKRIGLASTAGYEVVDLKPLGADEGMVLKFFDEEIAYDKGGDMIITKDQLESIILSILIFVIPVFQNAVAEKLNSKS